MSRIYFHSVDGNDAEIYGSERYYAGSITGSFLALSLKQFFGYLGESEALREFLPDDCYVKKIKNPPEFNQALEVYLAVAHDNLVIKGHTLSIFEMACNTALVAGSDAVKFLARLHGQCEIHCWVDGLNRNWLAGIIELGLASNTLRQGQGWDKVITLLKSANDSPIVCSYSVCEQFPNYGLAMEAGSWVATHDEDGDIESEVWYDLPLSERWEMCMQYLRPDTKFLELKPENWNAYYFGDGINGFDLSLIASDKNGEAINKSPRLKEFF